MALQDKLSIKVPMHQEDARRYGNENNLINIAKGRAIAQMRKKNMDPDEWEFEQAYRADEPFAHKIEITFILKRKDTVE